MSKLVLTADQIFALAYIMKARFLDHYYISLTNTGSDVKLWQAETQKQLVSIGLLAEDFSGNLLVIPELEDIIKPIYFGTKESTLDISIFGDHEGNAGYRFHFDDGVITMVKAIDDGFEVKRTNVDEIRRLIFDLISDDYNVNSEYVDMTFDADKITRVLVVKNAEVNVKNYTESFIESEGVIYSEDADNRVSSVSRTDFVERLFTILAEV